MTDKITLFLINGREYYIFFKNLGNYNTYMKFIKKNYHRVNNLS